MGLDTNYADATKALAAALDTAKMEYSQLARAMKKKAKEQKEKDANPDLDTNAMLFFLAAAKSACNDAAAKVKETKLAVMMAGVISFELYINLLSDEARQPWEKVMKA